MKDSRRWVHSDGGRSRYFKGEAGDCVVRAISIATGINYLDIYDEIAKLSLRERPRNGGRRSSPRNGVKKQTCRRYMENLAGWKWTPTMGIGTGCRVHLRPEELPGGRIIVSLSKHWCAVIDGVPHDTHDPSRGGTRCVYGYWSMDLDLSVATEGFDNPPKIIKVV